jgi:NADPH:quinone reductase-like Zn-dependent oxidoreductase
VREFPVILGWDISGTVVASGSGVYEVGDEVFAMAGFPDIGGGYAEYAAVAISDLARKPRGVDHKTAACAPMSALTAWQSLFGHAQLGDGKRVLIHPATGGVAMWPFNSPGRLAPR